MQPSSIQDSAVEVEEILHYAKPENGSVHVVVPGKIICFPTPADLPHGKRWMDFEADGAGTVRKFSAAFYADLFTELDVSVAICLHRSDYNRAAFIEQGIEVEDLGLDPSSPHMLHAIDRFLAVATAAPGMVALQSGSDGLGHLGALVLSYLKGRLGFTAESAVEWVRMVHPALLAAPTPPPLPDAGFRVVVTHGSITRTSSAGDSPSIFWESGSGPARVVAASAASNICRTLSAPDTLASLVLEPLGCEPAQAALPKSEGS